MASRQNMITAMAPPESTVDFIAPSDAPSDAPTAEPAAWSGGRRWAVLLFFSFLSGSNAFMLMDFADDYELSEALLAADATAVAFLYSLFLLCVMPAMAIASWAVVHRNVSDNRVLAPSGPSLTQTHPSPTQSRARL